jgi:hypothetical protein
MGSALQDEFCQMMSPPGRAKRKRKLLLDALLYVVLADLGLVSRQMEIHSQGSFMFTDQLTTGGS